MDNALDSAELRYCDVECCPSLLSCADPEVCLKRLSGIRIFMLHPNPASDEVFYCATVRGVYQ